MTKSRYEFTTRCRLCGELVTIENILERGYSGLPRILNSNHISNSFAIALGPKSKHKCATDGNIVLSDLVKIKEIEQLADNSEEINDEE